MFVHIYEDMTKSELRRLIVECINEVIDEGVGTGPVAVSK